MKIIIIFALLLELSIASTVRLKDVLASVDDQNHITQRVNHQRLYLKANNLADNASAPIELYGMGTKAYPVGGREDYEYSVGISKELSWGDTKAKDEKIGELANEAYLLEEQKKILNFSNSIKNLYHQHCMDYKNYKSAKQNYQEFAKLYTKKSKAYKYHEISKSELMQLKIEKNRLYAKLKEIKIIQQISKKRVYMLSRMDYSKSSYLSCRDIYPIRANISLDRDSFDITKKAHQKRIQGTQATIDRYSKSIEYVTLSIQYDKEIDIDKYSLGLSIPLSFTSNKSEQKRASAMYQNSSLDYEYKQSMLEKRTTAMALRDRLKSDALMIKSLKQNINNYKRNLLPLIKKSYDLGESSVIEYLLNRQNYHQIKQELFATQKRYYQRLFGLYSLIETKDN